VGLFVPERLGNRRRPKSLNENDYDGKADVDGCGENRQQTLPLRQHEGQCWILKKMLDEPAEMRHGPNTLVVQAPELLSEGTNIL